MEVRTSRASSVIVHRVPPDCSERFLEWQRGISAAVTAFPGYQATDVYPATNEQQQWVVILHFANPEALRGWLESPVRAEWLTKLRGEEARFQQKTLPSGFGMWFAGLFGPSDTPLPPAWKMALVVLLALYPTVMLLMILVRPYTDPLGMAAATLIGNVLSVALLQWAVTPALQIVLAPWLRARGPQGRAVTLIGLGVVVLVLIGLMFLFRAVTG